MFSWMYISKGQSPIDKYRKAEHPRGINVQQVNIQEVNIQEINIQEVNIHGVNLQQWTSKMWICKEVSPQDGQHIRCEPPRGEHIKGAKFKDYIQELNIPEVSIQNMGI